MINLLSLSHPTGGVSIFASTDMVIERGGNRVFYFHFYLSARLHEKMLRISVHYLPFNYLQWLKRQVFIRSNNYDLL